jgi:hypothetical protein
VRKAQPAFAECEHNDAPQESRAVRLVRRCLGCLALFDSEWAGERICRRCKGRARWRIGTGDNPE